MNTPYSSSLLAEETTSAAMPSMESPYRAQVQTMVAPPIAQSPIQYVMAQSPARSGRGETAALALVVLILAIGAAIAGFAIARESAPSGQELAQYQNLAAQEGFYSGRQSGYVTGRTQGVAESRIIAKYKGLISRAKQYNKGYAQGRRVGMTTPRYRPTNYGYGGGNGCRTWNCGRSSYGGYRGYGYGYGGYGGGVSSALSQAQSIANATGQSVDVIVG